MNIYHYDLVSVVSDTVVDDDYFEGSEEEFAAYKKEVETFFEGAYIMHGECVKSDTFNNGSWMDKSYMN